MVYRMLSQAQNFVSGLICTVKSKKPKKPLKPNNLKYLKTWKLFPKNLVFFQCWSVDLSVSVCMYVWLYVCMCVCMCVCVCVSSVGLLIRWESSLFMIGRMNRSGWRCYCLYYFYITVSHNNNNNNNSNNKSVVLHTLLPPPSIAGESNIRPAGHNPARQAFLSGPQSLANFWGAPKVFLWHQISR